MYSTFLFSNQEGYRELTGIADNEVVVPEGGTLLVRLPESLIYNPPLLPTSRSHDQLKSSHLALRIGESEVMGDLSRTSKSLMNSPYNDREFEARTTGSMKYREFRLTLPDGMIITADTPITLWGFNGAATTLTAGELFAVDVDGNETKIADLGNMTVNHTPLAKYGSEAYATSLMSTTLYAPSVNDIYDTDTTISGYSKYDNALISAFYKTDEGELLKTETNAASEVSRDASGLKTTVIIVGVGYQDLYAYTVDQPTDLKKDMPISVYNSESENITVPSSAVLKRVKARVTFVDTKANPEATQTVVAPDNEKYFNEAGYTPNGLNYNGNNVYDTVVKPSDSDSGLEFKGWTTIQGSNEVNFDGSTPILNSMTVYAVYGEKTPNFTYPTVPADVNEEVTSTPIFTNENDEVIDVPANTEFKLGENAPENVTIDPVTGVVTITPTDEQEGETVIVPVIATYPDGTEKTADAEFNVSGLENHAPTINMADQIVTEGQETAIPLEAEDVDGDPITYKVDEDELAKIGLSYNPNTQAIEGTPTVDDWAENEEKRSISVLVEATDDEGATTPDSFLITVQRDTDGDGDPDVTDPDDDNDGFTDEEEKDAGTDPKDPDSKPSEDTTAPVITPIEDQTVTEGDKIDAFVVQTDDPDATVTVDGLPEGVTFDPETGLVSGTPEVTWESSEEEKAYPVTITATDAAGNESTEEATITVQRDTDGDRNPDVTDPDDDNDGFTDEEEKDAGTDPKNPDSKPSEDIPTNVDGVVTPVNPTNESQDTGINVNNKDEDTEITAKDEDGKDVPVTIDENGNVIVTPGEDVDGPIEVTITDPDLPNGSVTITVPVNGHEAGRDDNATPEEKTTVDDSGVTPVDPTNESQDTGINVNNKDEDTEITAKDEDGKDVPVTIDENGNVIVTPGEDVDGPIEVTITDPDLPNGETKVTVPVNGHEAGRDDNESDNDVIDDTKPATTNQAETTKVDKAGVATIEKVSSANLPSTGAESSNTSLLAGLGILLIGTDVIFGTRRKED